MRLTRIGSAPAHLTVGNWPCLAIGIIYFVPIAISYGPETSSMSTVRCSELNPLTAYSTIIFHIVQEDYLLEQATSNSGSSLISLLVSESRFDTLLTQMVMRGVRREALYTRALITNNISTSKHVATTSRLSEEVLLLQDVCLAEWSWLQSGGELKYKKAFSSHSSLLSSSAHNHNLLYPLYALSKYFIRQHVRLHHHHRRRPRPSYRFPSLRLLISPGCCRCFCRPFCWSGLHWHYLQQGWLW